MSIPESRAKLERPASAHRLLDGRPRLVWVLLAALVIYSVALRAWDASQGLHGGKTFDERFSLANVAGVLAGNGLAPKQAYYPSLSYLPQAAVLWCAEELHRATGIEGLAIHVRGRRWSPTAYLLCRLTNVAFGGASLVLVFVVGRRLFGDAEGLAAAAVLGAFRRHVISSAHFKPDILVLLLTLLTFYWALLAVERPRRRAFLRAGFGVGLATAAKYTGAGAALSVTAAALVRWRDRRQWLWLFLAGCTAVATFVLLNPWLGDLYVRLRELAHGYALTGVEERSSPWVVLQKSTISVLSHHGWPAVFVVGGLAGLAWRVARPASAALPWSDQQRFGAILLLVQTVGYALAHAAVFPAFRAQNILPIAPFTSLLAGWAMVESYRWIARRWPPVQDRPVALAVSSIAALALVFKPGAEVYGRAVPTTWETAADVVSARLGTSDSRSVAYYGDRREFAGAVRHHGLVAFRADTRAPQLFPAPPLTDAEAFAPDARRPADSANVGTTELVSARPFASRGEPVMLLLHPWRLARTERLAVTVEGDGRLAAPLPIDVTAGAPISITVSVDRAARAPAMLVLQPNGMRMPLFPMPTLRSDQELSTGRFPLPAAGQTIELGPSTGAGRPPKVELHFWQAPSPTPR